jgi:hypothetical protein
MRVRSRHAAAPRTRPRARHRPGVCTRAPRCQHASSRSNASMTCRYCSSNEIVHPARRSSTSMCTLMLAPSLHAARLPESLEPPHAGSAAGHRLPETGPASARASCNTGRRRSIPGARVVQHRATAHRRRRARRATPGDGAPSPARASCNTGRRRSIPGARVVQHRATALRRSGAHVSRGSAVQRRPRARRATRVGGAAPGARSCVSATGWCVTTRQDVRWHDGWVVVWHVGQRARAPEGSGAGGG